MSRPRPSLIVTPAATTTAPRLTPEELWEVRALVAEERVAIAAAHAASLARLTAVRRILAAHGCPPDVPHEITADGHIVPRTEEAKG